MSRMHPVLTFLAIVRTQAPFQDQTQLVAEQFVDLPAGQFIWRVGKIALESGEPETIKMHTGFIFTQSGSLTIVSANQTAMLDTGEAFPTGQGEQATTTISANPSGTCHTIELVEGHAPEPFDRGLSIREPVPTTLGQYQLALFSGFAPAAQSFGLPDSTASTLLLVLSGSIVLERPALPALAMARDHPVALNVGTFRVDVTGDAKILMAKLTLADHSQ